MYIRHGGSGSALPATFHCPFFHYGETGEKRGRGDVSVFDQKSSCSMKTSFFIFLLILCEENLFFKKCFFQLTTTKPPLNALLSYSPFIMRVFKCVLTAISVTKWPLMEEPLNARTANK